MIYFHALVIISIIATFAAPLHLARVYVSID